MSGPTGQNGRPARRVFTSESEDVTICKTGELLTELPMMLAVDTTRLIKKYKNCPLTHKIGIPKLRS